MMSVGKRLRLRRLNKRGRTVIVAIDHGNSAGVVPGLEHPLEIVKICAGVGADGVLATPGIVETAAEELGQLAVLLRIDGAVSSLGPGGPKRLFCQTSEALALGADAVVASATLGAPFEAAELEKLGLLASEGRRWGLPVVAEILSERMLENQSNGANRSSSALPEDISRDVGMACRIGAELGADAIKTRYSGDVETFRRIVASTGRPVLVAGGPMRSSGLEATLRIVDEVLEAGASGVIFGPSVWQQPDPAEALQAVCAMVHDDTTVEEALESITV